MQYSKLSAALTAPLLLAAGVTLWVSPQGRTLVSTMLLSAIGEQGNKSEAGHAGHAHGREEPHGPEGTITLTAAQIERARINLAKADKGNIARTLTVPGTIVPDPDRIGRVAAKVIGTVAELRKRLGAPVTKGEVIAVLESREVADAKSEYLAALVNFDLQKMLFERAQTLWDGKIIPETQFLRSRTTYTEARLRLDTTRQKLSALDLDEAEVEALPRQPITALRHKEIRAPLSGRIVERKVDLGAPVGGEGQEKEIYVIADLSSVWVDLSVPTSELASIKEGRSVAISTRGHDKTTIGEIVFVSPLLNAETRAARAVAMVDNSELTWRPGAFVVARVTIEEQQVDLRVPRSALQTIGGEQVVFVRTPEGFEKREVVLGRGDDEHVEVVFGLDVGEEIAVTGTFVLKAELGKSEADHGHVH
jgi:cobalt-zinc-cadmium efflux system membrane fusion protein